MKSDKQFTKKESFIGYTTFVAMWFLLFVFPGPQLWALSGGL